ncbi:MAG: DUF5696 domain-containing protein, partial [Victivallaceae bacterium]|nr:DUF5696 domain-containing protein [Victivallaceae bacterium]
MTIKRNIIITAVGGVIIASGLAAAQTAAAPETMKNRPIAVSKVDQVDGELGNVSIAKFGQNGDYWLFDFEDALLENNDRCAFGKNAFTVKGLKRESRAGYFMSGSHSLVGAGREKQVTASIGFDRPVKGVGFVAQFATGTLRVAFFNADNEKIWEVEQNGQGDPSGNGTWADYFIAHETPNEFGEISRVEFMRLNLNEGSIPEFAVDDLVVREGLPPLKIVEPQEKTADFSLLVGRPGEAAPLRGGKPSYAIDGRQVKLVNRLDGVDYAYTLDAAQGLSSLAASVNGDQALTVGAKWPFAMDGVPVAWQLKNAVRSADGVKLEYLWKNAKAELPVTVKLSLSGGSLVIDLEAKQGGPALAINPPRLENVLKISDSGNTAMRNGDAIAFYGFGGDIAYIPSTQRFYSYNVDWTRSAGLTPYPGISYSRVDGKAPALRERLVVTLADSLDKVLPGIPNQVSPYRKMISGSVIVEFWYGHFDELNELLATAHAYGMDDLIVLMHRWQNAGFDRKYPSVMPPSPSRGGLDSLADAAATAKANGQRIALHENYKDFYPDSPLWNENDLLLDSSGKPANAWADSKEMAPGKIAKYARPIMESIHKQIGTTACFLDVHSTHLPWWRVDFRKGVAG